MPLFEYRCKKCGAKYEMLILSGSDEKPTCPKCGGGEAEKLFSVFSSGSSHGDMPCGESSCPTGGMGGGCCPGCKGH